MQDFLLQIIDKFGYIGISLLILIENVFPPIPSEAVLLFGGFMTTYTTMNPWLAIAAATVGSVGGACILYWIGTVLNKERLDKLISGKLGHFLRLKPEHIDKAEYWFDHHGYKTVFFGRCIPIVRSLISIPAGMAKMPFLKFLGLTIAGSAIWNSILIWVGNWSGSAWESNLKYFNWYSKAALVILAIICLLVLRRFLKKSKKTD